MRVIVCGGRDYFDQRTVNKALDLLHERKGVELVIQGGAKGADHCAWVWAVSREVPTVQVNADWDKHGKRAGYIRNQVMLDGGKPDGVVAFPGGAGTNMMSEIATKAGVKVWHPVK